MLVLGLESQVLVNITAYTVQRRTGRWQKALYNNAVFGTVQRRCSRTHVYTSRGWDRWGWL